jgi:outer membrane biosynthesis protein TonB
MSQLQPSRRFGRAGSSGWRALVALAPPCLVAACELFQAPAANAPPSASSTPAASAAPAPELPPTAKPEPEPEPVAQPSAAPVEPGVVQSGGQTRGALPKAAIAEGVARGSDDFERCYLRARQPGQRGVIRVNFVIAPDGTVPYAAALEQGTDFPDETVIQCVLEAFQKLTFPKPAGGRVVSTYPLKFEPLPDAGAPPR